jgi:RNA-directed DNA polymerase
VSASLPSPPGSSAATAAPSPTGAALLGSLTTRGDVAATLGTTWRTLAWLLFGAVPRGHYRIWTIKKRWGGTREIRAPGPALAKIQDRLRHILDDAYTPRGSTHGYVRERNVRTNAAPHVGARYVLNIDLADFFPSIHVGRVRGLFLKPPFNCADQVATVLAQICCSEGGLPIGAPTSPVVSNMICRRLDSQLRPLAQKHGCKYTRYADDITFSTRRDSFPAALAYLDDEGKVRLGSPLADVIDNNGFSARDSKSRLQRTDARQLVTGVVVNQRLNVDRRYIRRIRAMLHNWETKGLAQVQQDLEERYDQKDRHPNSQPRFVSVLRGRIAYLSMIRGDSDELVRRFLEQFENLLKHRPKNHGLPPPGTSAADGNRALENRRLLTIMFTDIVDSTARATLMGDRKWHDVLEEHHRRVRSRLRRYGAQEIKTIGDAFLATFDSPSAAIQCGLAIQDAMSGLGIDVKVGLHTGELLEAPGDIEGVAVDNAARVAAAAHGGDVLVSSTLLDVVAGGDFDFLDRGPHDLKGIGRSNLYRAERRQV